MDTYKILEKLAMSWNLTGEALDNFMQEAKITETAYRVYEVTYKKETYVVVILYSNIPQLIASRLSEMK